MTSSWPAEECATPLGLFWTVFRKLRHPLRLFRYSGATPGAAILLSQPGDRIAAFFKRAPRTCGYRRSVINQLKALSALFGRNGSASEWRNQNLLDYSAISKRVWKNSRIRR